MPFHAVFTRTLRYVKRSKKLQRQDATHLALPVSIRGIPAALHAFTNGLWRWNLLMIWPERRKC